MAPSPPPLQVILDSLASDSSNEEAWRSLYHRLWPYVYTTIRYRIGDDPDQTEDLTQEVFFRLLRHTPFERVPKAREFRSYVGRMAVNVVRSAQKSALHRAEMHLRSAEENDVVDGSNLENASLHLEAEEMLDEAKQSLSKADLILLQLVMDGYSPREIAPCLDISYSAAGVRIYRLRNKIRGILEQI